MTRFSAQNNTEKKLNSIDLIQTDKLSYPSIKGKFFPFDYTRPLYNDLADGQTRLTGLCSQMSTKRFSAAHRCINCIQFQTMTLGRLEF